MVFFNQFDDFDPIKGYTPEHPFSCLPEIAGRARYILRGKSLDQLKAAAERISREIERYFDHEKYLAVSDLRSKLQTEGIPIETYFYWDGNFRGDGRWVFNDSMLDDLGVPTESNCSEVDALKAIIQKRDSNFFLPKGAPEPEADEYPEGTSHELFAVLALWLVAETLEWTETNMSIAGGRAIKAMDAVCYAEQLREIDWLVAYHKVKSNDELSKALLDQQSEFRKLAKQDSTERAKELNKHRHAETTKAKELVTAEWAKSPSKFPSAEKAGIHFAKWIASQGISKSFEPRTITNWIRTYAKENGIKFR